MKGIAPLMLAALLTSPLPAQSSRTGPEWTTAGMDAQRSRSVPADPQISLETMQQPGFTLLWKQPLLHVAGGAESLSEPVLVNTFIGYKGFKALAVVGAKDALFAVDYDLGRPYWEKHFSVPEGTGGCAVGMAVAPGRLTPLVPPPVTGSGVHGGYRSAVSRPGEGVPLKEVARVPPAAAVSTPPPAPASTQAAAPANAAAPNGPGIGGTSGPGGVPADAAPLTGPVRTGPAPGTGLYKGSQPIFAVSTDGVLHAISQGSAKELQRPVPFVPAGSGLFSLIDVDSTVYAATRPGCGASSNAVYAMDVSGPERGPATLPASWHASTGSLLGAPAFTASGTLVVATEQALIALAPKILQVKYTATDKGTLQSPPIVFTQDGRDFAAVAASGGRLLLQDTGGDAPAVALSMGTPNFLATTLATWTDGRGDRWLLAAEGSDGNAMRAFRLTKHADHFLLEAAWQTRSILAPGPPAVVNGVVFALATGQKHGPSKQAASHRSHATLYALDAATGRELWNSGSSITSTVNSSALSFSPGQIYVGTADGSLYAFGFPVPRQ